MFEGIIDWVKTVLSPFLEMPNSTLFVFGLTVALTLLTVAANRLLTDVDQLREYEIETKQYMKELNEARSRKDRRVVSKLERKEPRIRSLQSIVAKQRSKVSLIFMFPLMALYLLLGAIYSTRTVAILPFNAPLIGQYLSFGWWYLICYFMSYTLLSRFFGLTFETGEAGPKAMPLEPHEPPKPMPEPSPKEQETLKLEEQLAKLDAMYLKSRISQEAYEKLKQELHEKIKRITEKHQE